MMGRPKGSKNKSKENIFYGYGRKVANKILNRLKFRESKLKVNENNTVKGTIEIIEIKGNKKVNSISELRQLQRKGIAKVMLKADNLITNNGLNWECDRFYQNALDPMSHVATGTDDTAVSSTDSALYSELARVAASFTDTSNVTSTSAYFGPGIATGNWKEAGILNNSVGGILYNRVVFDYVKGAGIGTYVVFTHTRNNA